jgi:hypothetical protein
MTAFAESILNTNRRYRKLNIIKSRDRLDLANQPYFNNSLFVQLGAIIRELRIDWSNAMRPREASLELIMNRRRLLQVRGGFGRGADNFGVEHFDNIIEAQAHNQVREEIYNEFTRLIGFFGNLQKLELLNVHLEKSRPANAEAIEFPHLKELVTKQCDAYCFELFSAVTTLTKLHVTEPWWSSRQNGIDTFELFLVQQTNLKDLLLKSLQYPRLFQTDRTENITFKLEKLVLKNVYFANKDIANAFFRLQNELREIDFQMQNEKVRALDDMFWYHNILRTVVSNNNSHLHTIKIEKMRYKIEDCEFISKMVNPFVKNFSYFVTSEDNSSELFKCLIRMFPNLESVDFKADDKEDTDTGVCFDEGTVLERVESLAIKNCSVRSLVNVHASALKNFEYVPGKTGEGGFIDDLFGGFFHRHRNIKHLVIGSSSERSYFFVSFNLCHLIVNFLTQLESITIYNFCEVNKSVKLLCNMPKLKTLTLSTSDYQQFTAKTKVECSRNDLKLVHVTIPSISL